MVLTDRPAFELSQGLAGGEFSARELMEAALERIEATNPAVNALLSLRPRGALLAEAHAADHSERRGWLHGLPVAIKDLVATRGLRTTYGSPLFADFVPEADDLLAARMRAAGAIIIGKTNTSEWGQGSHTFNPVQGVTRNPYDLSRSAGGSSGGAAAALAARMVPVADGSDMMGSLRNPAAFCNVYGFRPTWGLVPANPGGDTFLHTLSTNGPMARTVRDLAILLETLAGPNPATPFDRPAESFANRLRTSVRGQRIGWIGDWGGAHPCEPGILEACERALDVFADEGAVIEALAPPYPADELWWAWTVLRGFLAAGSLGGLYDNAASRRKLKPETIWEIESGRRATGADLYLASTIRSRWFAQAARLFERFDAIAMPAAQVWPFPADWRWPRTINSQVMDTYHRWMEVVVPVSLAGLPAISLPAGFGAAGLPTGLQLAGRVGDDAAILALGHAYHEATDWPGQRPPPLVEGRAWMSGPVD